VDTSKKVVFVIISSEMTFYDWGKEGVYVVEYRASTIFANNPILVVLVNHEYEGFEVA
jgi:hypothetical protein